MEVKTGEERATMGNKDSGKREQKKAPKPKPKPEPGRRADSSGVTSQIAGK